jgi:hypothetical protein
VQRTTWSTFLAHRWTVAAAVLVAVVYGVSLSILPKHVFWMPDEGAKLFELEAAVVLGARDDVPPPFAGQRLIPGNASSRLRRVPDRSRYRTAGCTWGSTTRSCSR